MSYRARVSLAQPDGQMRIPGQALNLSVAGMFVHAAGSCALGSDVVCDMPLPSGMCQVKGRVTRIQRLSDATGMAIQFVDLPAQQQAMLNEMVERSREPSIPLAVRFEGMQSPIQCRGVFFDDKLRLRTKVPFLRIGSSVQVSLDANHVDGAVSADMTGTLSGLALKASPIDGVPRLAIDLDVVRTESDDPDNVGPTPLEKAIAACVSTSETPHTPTPTPLPLTTLRSVSPTERMSSVAVSGELRPRARVRTEEVEAPPIDASGLLVSEAPAAPAATNESIPAARASETDWDETQAIAVADRRRQAPGRRSPERGRSGRIVAAPAKSGHSGLTLFLVGAVGLGLGVLAVRSGLSTGSSPPAAMAGRVSAGETATTAAAPAAIHPTVVPLPPPEPVAAAPGNAAPAGDQAARSPGAAPIAPRSDRLTAVIRRTPSASKKPAPATVAADRTDAPAAAGTATPTAAPTATPTATVATLSPSAPAAAGATGEQAPPATPAPRKVARRPRPATQFALDSETRQFRLAGASALDLGGAKLTGLTGLTGAAGANFRGINVAVSPTATVLHVIFPDAETGGVYAVQVTPSWPTAFAISDKTAEGFTITFAVPAPEAATFDWLLVH